MNCEPGDLAYIVNSSCGNDRRFVTVICRDDLATDMFDELIWKVSAASPIRDLGGRMVMEGSAPDAKLRPIRDNDGEDESFRWAPSPTQKELA